VPHRAGPQADEQHVVLGVRGGQDDQAGTGVTEQRALERAKPGCVQVLDDLDDGRGVESAQPAGPVSSA